MNPIATPIVVLFLAVGAAAGMFGSVLLAPVFWVATILVASTPKVANAWQRFAILRVGKLQSVEGPELPMILSIVDSITAVIDECIQTIGFNAEQVLTKDTASANADVIIFWHVYDTQRAALAITDYRQITDRATQTSLREMIGVSMFSILLSDRGAADEQPRAETSEKTTAWGVTVSPVEVRDVAILVALQDAMSRQAQTEHEKQARVILGSAEVAVAAKFAEIMGMYEGRPQAPQLRAMNIIYEIAKERGAAILMPISMVDSTNPVVVAFGVSGCTEQTSAVLPLRMAAAAVAA